MAPPAHLITALQRRPKLLVIAFTASVLLAVTAMEAADLWWRHERVLRAAQSRAQNLAFVLSEYVRGSFAVADASLRQLAIHGDRLGGSAAGHDEWDPILSAAKTALPGSGSMSVTDAQGRIIHSTERAIVGQSRRDDYLYQQLSTAARHELVVDRPFLAVVGPKRYLIAMGRRLTARDGTFNGMVVATLLPEMYREFFRTVDVGQHGVTWVFHPDGVGLFREPSQATPLDETADGSPLLQSALRSHGDGIVEGRLQADGPEFVSAYRAVGSPPLIVAVSLSRDEILADWRHQRWISSLAFGALTLTLAAMVLVLFRQIDMRTGVERELEEAHQVEAARLRDTNERLEGALEREQRARRETEEASYLKDVFLMTVSHELRTPLTAIYGWVRMLADELIPPEQQARALAAIERNARAQTKLIDDLLEVSRALSGKLRIDAHPVNVADVVRAAIETLRPALDAKAIGFEPALDPEAGVILADPDRLQQVVWNLVSNAIKFTPEGGTVRLRLARVGTNVEIVVSDSGVGISPEFLPWVFERFRQADAGSRRRFGGLGLGLAIVRHLVELHGGTVTAESAGEGKGATFRVLLPARTLSPELPPEHDVTAAIGTARGAARLDGVRVLVVDDEADARELFASILESAGATALTASSAAAARQTLAAEHVDVLLSDIEMPDEDGYQLLERALRHQPLKAVALTAYARTADRRRALDAGFDSYLAKPVEPAELVAVIASLLGANDAAGRRAPV